MPTPTGLSVPSSFLRIRERVGDEVFSARAVESLLGPGMKTYAELARLVNAGWLFRVARGRYATVDPLVRLTPKAEAGIGPFRKKEWFPVLERAVGGVLRVYEGRLLGIVLFGSAARGTETPSSDLDLAVVATGLPDTMPEELAETDRAERSAQAVAQAVFEGGRAFHPSSILAVPPGAFDAPGRIMLGVASDGRILYDPKGDVARGLRRLRGRLRAAGVRTHRTDGGRPYWSVGTLFDEEAPA
jgi:hypothetical protein